VREIRSLQAESRLLPGPLVEALILPGMPLTVQLSLSAAVHGDTAVTIGDAISVLDTPQFYGVPGPATVPFSLVVTHLNPVSPVTQSRRVCSRRDFHFGTI
jgi:hypothetical protein